MTKRRLILEGKCDRTTYPLDPVPEFPIIRVAYRPQPVTIHPNGKSAEELLFEAPTTRSYLRVGKTDTPPETEKEAYWFLRALYEHLKRPVWYLFGPNHLLVWPPVPNDGDWIVVEFDIPPVTL